MRAKMTIFVTLLSCYAVSAGAQTTARSCQSLFTTSDATNEQLAFKNVIEQIRTSQAITPDLVQQATLAAAEFFKSSHVEYTGGPSDDSIAKKSIPDAEMEFVIATTGTQPLNRFAASMKKSLGVDVHYSISGLVKDGKLMDGLFRNQARVLMLDATFPSDMKISAVSAHEIGHAYMNTIATQWHENCALWSRATAKQGFKLPFRDFALSAYGDSTTYGELWAYLISLRIMFNAARASQDQPTFKDNLNTVWAEALTTSELYEGLAGYTKSLSDSKNEWEFWLRDPDSVTFYIINSTNIFQTQFYGKDVIESLGINPIPDAQTLNAKAVYLQKKQIAQLEPLATKRIQDMTEKISKAQIEMTQLFASVKKILAQPTDKKANEALFAQMDENISRARELMHPLVRTK